MMFKKASKPQNRIDTLIGAGTTVTGDVTFSGGLRIDGEVRGNVNAASEQSSTLVVSEHARIEGEISVSHLVINGTVIGPVVSRGFLELQAKARVTGDVEYSAIEMHLGAVVQGKLVHTGQPAKSVELKLASGGN
ncbi:MAG TPA: polymer-forming cytoskeletal protein [Rhodocyclaceae bacterium]|nr:polymer-forming cytoskeletal protein [Rhodocyclaceae bacterium]